MSGPILAAMLSCHSVVLSDEEKQLFSQYNPLGVTLFSRNLQSIDQTKKLVNDIKNAVNRDDVLIAVDEEGGRVSRLSSLSAKRYVSAEILGALPVEYSKVQAELIAAEMHELGINVNYAPVVDRKYRPQTAALESRCFGESGETVAKYALTMADSYIEAGICPCIKHIPGHFSSLEDPHLSSPSTNLTISQFRQETKYLKKFKNYPMAMTSHITIDAVDSQSPVTMSKKAVKELLREWLEFDGFIISDAIDMHALHGSISEKVSKSLDAGMDAVCYCLGDIKEMYDICKTQRFMTEKSLIRFAKIKNIIQNKPKKVDVANLRAVYEAGIGNHLNAEYSYDATEILNKMLKIGG